MFRESDHVTLYHIKYHYLIIKVKLSDNSVAFYKRKNTIFFFIDLDAAVRPSLSQEYCIQVTVCINCTFKVLFEYYCSCPGAERTQDSGADRGLQEEQDLSGTLTLTLLS